MNPLTRRASITGGLIAAALIATTRDAAAVPVDLTAHPSDQTMHAIGASPDGFASQDAIPWNDDLDTHNLRDTENRETLFHRHHRDGIDAIMAALAPPTSTLRILCVGDSITVGAGSTSPGGTYDRYYLGTGPGYQPWLASNLLRRRIKADITTVAQGGQTLRTMTPPTLAALPTARPDIVLIDLGTNDIGGATDFTPDWTQRYGSLLDQILASSPAVKIACATIPTSRDPYLAARTPALNTAITTAVNARKGTGRVTVADLTQLSPHWTGDGLHPLEAGHLHNASAYTAALTNAGWIPA